MSAKELFDLSTASGIAAAIRDGEVSALEVTDAAIQRISDRNPALNAITFTDFEGARQAARRLQQKISRKEPLGPLAGVPMLMKDLYGFKPGWPASYGLVSGLRGNLATNYSVFPQRVEAAGGILLGQTNSPVFGFRGTTDNRAVGPTRNPFSLRHNAGGSSGGSAAAVADGIVPIAGATDGGGSIRIPSAWCGAVGFQPSAGRVPFIARPNAFGSAFYLYEGPIARNVKDISLAMAALQGQAARDPASLTVDVDFEQALHRPIKGKRIAFTPDFGIFPVDPRIVALLREAVQAFEAAGATVEEVDLRLPYSQDRLSDIWCRTTAIGIHETLEALLAGGHDIRTHSSGDLPAEMMKWVDSVPSLKVTELFEDQVVRTQVLDCFADLFQTFDYVVAPTLACMPVRNASEGLTQGPDSINGTPVDPLIGWCLTYLTNFTGNPSASVPAGLIDGLPVGMLVIGPRHGDADVLAAISEFEQARPWGHIYRIPESRLLS
ncbi:MAG: amidase [Acidovorax sp.]|nr:amidase [Acidovorax sp.]